MNKLKLTILILFVQITLIAQPQWKFHIAFEDATGAKDTIWCIWDTTATGGILGQYDSLLGEGPVIMDYNQFNTYIINENYDTTKTLAYPYNGSLAIIVHAFNFQYPISISWDSSLFHAPFLPWPVYHVNHARIDNDYFFSVNNCGCSQFDMLQDDHVLAPAFNWFSQNQFPMRFYLIRDLNLPNNDFSNNNICQIFPNISNDVLNIKSKNGMQQVDIIDVNGKEVETYKFNKNQNEFKVDIQHLIQGIYLLRITNQFNTLHYEKFIKTN